MDMFGDVKATAAVVCANLLALVLATPAQASINHTVDSNQPSSRLHAVDGWKGWDNVASVGGIISQDFALSGSQSMLVQGYTDAVAEWNPYTSGSWSLKTYQYIPSGQTGNTYLILMNNYIAGANNNSSQWSSQLKFDLAAGTVRDDFRGGLVTITPDQWAEIRVDINLDLNTVSHYYNNQLISSGAWTTGASSLRALNALDLYTADNNRAYYDNLSLSAVPAPSTACLVLMSGVMLFVRRERPRRV